MLTEQLKQFPEDTRDALLFNLKVRGEMTMAELCEALNVTYMGVKRYLAEYQAQGLVESRIVQKSRGRPLYKYRLSQKAQALFPSGYEGVLTEVLDAVRETSGHKGVMDLLTLRNERVIRTQRPRFDGKELRGKVEELAKLFADNGYMSQWEELPDGNFFIYQQHCPLHSLTGQYRQLCNLELQLMRSLLGVKVIRQSYMLKNDPVCGYVVHADKAAESGGVS